MATKVVVDFGPPDVYCNLSLWRADVAMVYGQKPTSPGVFFGGNL